ncbi:MAG TPA: RNA-binding protein [Puia sp.]|nr:RNA-binding protein [Puia sp.]
MNIRISNIGLNATDNQLRKLFVPFGTVDYAMVHRNSLNGRSLKSGEVRMPIPQQARQAIISLDKTILDGNIISVQELPSDLY